MMFRNVFRCVGYTFVAIFGMILGVWSNPTLLFSKWDWRSNVNHLSMLVCSGSCVLCVTTPNQICCITHVFDFHWVNNCGLMLFSGVDELEWMCIMYVILWSSVNYINSAVSITCFTCSNILLYMNVITHSRCVFVFWLIAICSGEPSHDRDMLW